MSDQEFETMLEEITQRPGESTKQWEDRIRQIQADGRWPSAEFWERAGDKVTGHLTAALALINGPFPFKW